MSIIYSYRIPDKTRPISEAKRGLGGPSGQLIDFKPIPITSSDVVGKIVEELSTGVGTYGMGGLGFFGLKLSEKWLVIAIERAGEWMTSKGRNVEDSFHDNYDRPTPWIADWLTGKSGDELSENLIGTKITNIEIQAHSLSIEFDNGFDLTISEDSSNRPLIEGSKEQRIFNIDDNLKKAVFLSPTTEIWDAH